MTPKETGTKMSMLKAQKKEEPPNRRKQVLPKDTGRMWDTKKMVVKSTVICPKFPDTQEIFPTQTLGENFSFLNFGVNLFQHKTV